MKVKRFVADDMRTAIRLVKEELGANAVILSNRKVDGQVEILAAMDYDEQLINQALDTQLNTNKPGSAAAYYEQAAAQRDAMEKQTIASSDMGDTSKSVTEQNISEHELAPAAAPAPVEKPAAGLENSPASVSDHQAAGLYQSMAQEKHGITEMRDELKLLRAMIENQQTMSEWGSLTEKHPLRVTLYKRLTEMGLSQDVCKYLAKGLDNHAHIDQAMQAALKQLVHQLPVADDDILNRGGVYAMVGPTGVGKTTTIAKLAARFAMQHGQRHVALISTDNYRIGAHEQLMTYGRLLGVPVHQAADKQELQALLHKLYDKKLILIDTAGMSQRDLRLSEQFVHLGNHEAIIKSYLVLSANAQLPALNETIKSFKKANLAGCILTKTDEAVSLGGVLSAMIKHHLPAAFVSDGQRVPEDLHRARARELVDEALNLMKLHREPSDDEFMAVAFSGGVSHAHL
ncbi:MAG: flagellar biosynthesis protein FlhF [Gammaproteobacteria bacterium]|nr:flagellar biosynthesis protein FlhF [Gammaproteobacteria bacterium]